MFLTLYNILCQGGEAIQYCGLFMVGFLRADLLLFVNIWQKSIPLICNFCTSAFITSPLKSKPNDVRASLVFTMQISHV